MTPFSLLNVIVMCFSLVGFRVYGNLAVPNDYSLFQGLVLIVYTSVILSRLKPL